MTDDDPFRLILMALCVVFAPIGFYHRIRSHTGEPLDRLREGLFILLGLRLTAAVMFVGVLAWMIRPTWMAWSSLPIPSWLRWAGLPLLVLASLLFVWTMRCLGGNLTDTVVTRKVHHLVTAGPYAWVRHPFYASFALGVVGGSLMMASGFTLALGAAVFAFLAARTRIEEGLLIERFGDAYRDYMQRVGRFVPKFGRRLANG